jgi:hypothetical protein
MREIISVVGILIGFAKIRLILRKGSATLMEYAKLYEFPLEWPEPNRPVLDMGKYRDWCAEWKLNPKTPWAWSRHSLENERDRRRKEKIRMEREKIDSD